MCHAETRSGEMSMEEHGIMKDLRPMAGNAEVVVEPVSLVGANKSVVQTAKPRVAWLNPCDSGISSESEVCSEAGENKLRMKFNNSQF